jgi:natural product precursor
MAEPNCATVIPDAQREKLMKKLTLSKETLRTLDEQELSLVVGGASGGNKPKCPNTKENSCDCNTNGAVCHP